MAASRVACASFNIGTNTTITITRDKSSYTHTITWKFGSASGTIATKTSQTSIVWTPNASTLYAQIPNTISGYGTITCQTYDGNTLIGTTTAGFYAYAVKADCLPDVSADVVDTNASTIALTGDSSKLVCYMSKPKVTANVTAKNGATVKAVQIYNPVGLTADSSPYTFDTVYSEDFKVKAIDSRGYTTEILHKTPGFVLYDPAHIISASIKRTESTSTTATATTTGFCFNGSFGAVGNTLALKYRYKTAAGSYGEYVSFAPTWNSDGTFTATVDIPDLALNETYYFEFAAEDKLVSFVKDDVVLGQSTGDIRIAKEYVQMKNSVYSGDVNNEAWKCFGVRRKVSGKRYKSNFGTGVVGNEGAAVLELYKEVDGTDKIVSRAELRSDGHLYNLFTSMSFAEMMASAPSSNFDGSQGHIVLNGGSSSPILIMWGVVYVTPAGANIATTQRVNFNYRFQGIPFVIADCLSGVPVQLDVSANRVEENGFDISLQRTNTVTTSVVWLAIGNGTSALPE